MFVISVLHKPVTCYQELFIWLTFTDIYHFLSWQVVVLHLSCIFHTTVCSNYSRGMFFKTADLIPLSLKTNRSNLQLKLCTITQQKGWTFSLQGMIDLDCKHVRVPSITLSECYLTLSCGKVRVFFLGLNLG